VSLAEREGGGREDERERESKKESAWVGGSESQQSHSPVEGEWPVVVRPLLSSKRRSHFETYKSLGKNKNMAVGPDEVRNQERLCWRGPTAIYWTGLSLAEAMFNEWWVRRNSSWHTLRYRLSFPQEKNEFRIDDAPAENYKYDALMLCQQRQAYVLYREINVRILVMCFNVENFLLVFISRDHSNPPNVHSNL
jgi:hypothetical protein